MPGERRGLVADALLEVAVGADGEDVVVEQVGAEAGPEVGLGERDADAVGDPLAERSGGHLDPRGVPVLGVPRRRRAPLAELLQVVEREPVAREVQVGVEEHRRVPGRQHEPVPVGPGRVAGVVLHDPGEQDVGQRRQGQRRTRVPRVRLLHGVDRQSAGDVDAADLEVGRGHPGSSRWGCARHARLEGACPQTRPPGHGPTTAAGRARSRRGRGSRCRRASALRDPTGPSSPAQNIPAVGIGPSISAMSPESWSGSPKSARPRPLQVNTSAALPRLAGEQRPQVLVGGVGVADVELDGAPDLDLLAHRDRSGVAVGADARCARGSRRVRSRPGARRRRSRSGGPAAAARARRRRPGRRAPAAAPAPDDRRAPPRSCDRPG